MKKLLLLFLLCPFIGFSQATTGFHRVSKVLSKANGSVTAQVVPYATVVVTSAATGTAATIYSDPLLTVPITGSTVVADGSGNYGYYIPLDYCVTENISSPGQGSSVIQNICQNTSGSGSSSIDACSIPGGDLGSKIIAAYTKNPPPVQIVVAPCAAWTTAITLPATDSLLFLPGTYTMTGGNKLLGSNVIDGTGTLTLQNADSSGELFIVTGSHVSFSQNLTFDGNRSNQTVTTFGTSLISLQSTGTSFSPSDIRVGSTFQNCKVNCVAGVANVGAPNFSQVTLLHANFLSSGAEEVNFLGVDYFWSDYSYYTDWGIETNNSDAVAVNGQPVSGTCSTPQQGVKVTHNTFVNTVGTKFSLEMTSLGSGCYAKNAIISGNTSTGASLGVGGNGFSLDLDQSTVTDNSLTPPKGVAQTGWGGMEITATHTTISNNVIEGGDISISNDSYRAAGNVDLTANNIKVGYVANPKALILGGGGAGQAISHIRVNGGNLDLNGWQGADCEAVLLGLYANVYANMSDVSISGVTMHNETGATFSITGWSITSNVVTFTGSFSGLAAYTTLKLSGFGTSTFFNGQGVVVNTTGLSTTSFQAAFTHANGSATESGTASTGINNCHGVYSTASDGSSGLSITKNTFTGLLGGFGDQGEPTVGYTDVTYTDNILRGNTSIYDNTPPSSSVVIRQYGNSSSATDATQSLNGGAAVDTFGQSSFPGGTASGSLTQIPNPNGNTLIGLYDGNQACSGGGSLASWSDQSGSGNNLAPQGTQATCVTSAINGLAAVQMVSGGTNGYYKANITYPTQNPGWAGYNTTLVVVYKKSTSSTGYVADLGTNNTGATQTGFLQYTNATTLFTANDGQTSPNGISATVPDDGGWHIAMVTNQWETTVGPPIYGTQTLYFDGAQVAQTTTLSNPTFANGIDCGGSQSSGDNSAAVTVAYCAVYGGTLTSAQITSIGTYLAHRFNLTQAGVWYIDSLGNANLKSVTTGPVSATTVLAGTSVATPSLNGVANAQLLATNTAAQNTALIQALAGVKGEIDITPDPTGATTFLLNYGINLKGSTLACKGGTSVLGNTLPQAIILSMQGTSGVGFYNGPLASGCKVMGGYTVGSSQTLTATLSSLSFTSSTGQTTATTSNTALIVPGVGFELVGTGGSSSYYGVFQVNANSSGSTVAFQTGMALPTETTWTAYFYPTVGYMAGDPTGYVGPPYYGPYASTVFENLFVSGFGTCFNISADQTLSGSVDGITFAGVETATNCQIGTLALGNGAPVGVSGAFNANVQGLSVPGQYKAHKVGIWFWGGPPLYNSSTGAGSADSEEASFAQNAIAHVTGDWSNVTSADSPFVGGVVVSSYGNKIRNSYLTGSTPSGTTNLGSVNTQGEDGFNSVYGDRTTLQNFGPYTTAWNNANGGLGTTTLPGGSYQSGFKIGSLGTSPNFSSAQIIGTAGGTSHSYAIVAVDYGGNTALASAEFICPDGSYVSSGGSCPSNIGPASGSSETVCLPQNLNIYKVYILQDNYSTVLTHFDPIGFGSNGNACFNIGNFTTTTFTAPSNDTTGGWTELNTHAVNTSGPIKFPDGSIAPSAIVTVNNVACTLGSSCAVTAYGNIFTWSPTTYTTFGSYVYAVKFFPDATTVTRITASLAGSAFSGCSVNPQLQLADCGTTLPTGVGSCTAISGASLTLSNGSPTIWDTGAISVGITAGHYVAFEGVAGTGCSGGTNINVTINYE